MTGISNKCVTPTEHSHCVGNLGTDKEGEFLEEFIRLLVSVLNPQKQSQASPFLIPNGICFTLTVSPEPFRA